MSRLTFFDTVMYLQLHAAYLADQAQQRGVPEEQLVTITAPIAEKLSKTISLAVDTDLEGVKEAIELFEGYAAVKSQRAKNLMDKAKDDGVFIKMIETALIASMKGHGLVEINQRGTLVTLVEHEGKASVRIR